MSKKGEVLCIVVLSVLFLTAPLSIAQSGDITSRIFHQSLGEVVDTGENVRYHIFGEIDGFTAARIYEVGEDQFELHVLRNAGDRAQIVILDLPSGTYAQLRRDLEDRINRAPDEDRQFDDALCPIDEAKWLESSGSKKLVLRDGNQLLVTLEQSRNDTLVVQTADGLQVAVPDVFIAEVIDLGGEIRQEPFSRVDPGTTKLFFAPTGRGLKAGTGYFADYYIFFPTLALGLTDFFSVSFGASLIPGANSQLFYLAPKLSLPATAKLNFAAGMLYLNIPDEEDDPSLGYAVTTVGDERSSITFGAGLPLNSDSDKNPVVFVGAEAQISNRAKFITENWITTGDDRTVIFSGGVRFFGDNIAVNLALITVEEAFNGNGFPFLPWVDFSVYFGD